MGVCIIEDDISSDSYDEDCTTCCSSSSRSSTGVNIHKNKTAKPKMGSFYETKTEILNNATTTTTTTTPLVNFLRPSKDLVGNCKEFRIENNKCDLRVIGNGNRLRIGNNEGSIQVIGNSTRLKINNNSGYIKYTGNDGRVTLGSESAQQTVDYIGCNGILKIINAMQLSTVQRNKCKKAKTSRDTTHGACGMTETVIESNAASFKLRGKSASYGGAESNCKLNNNSPATDNATQWQQFNNVFTKTFKNKNLSLPNLKENNFNKNWCNCNGSKSQKNCNISNDNKNNSKNNSNKIRSNNINVSSNINVINNVGNIVIRNSVNVNI
ncbi:myb-like protein I [Teleopsis dalmanni]|uniref:myb-like protein I n=1 Tax=Teleopsis dalmanni TaxID=139649 RepID=UPI0018CD1576|nr:myb-like protein I [Teleopsis dalmanni]XP_037953159.1 myb-like protein I [Teleopsis dalmanni]